MKAHAPRPKREEDEEREADGRLSANKAGYMELEGAVKDGDCHKVYVEDGISKELGCCNEFGPQGYEVKQFRCGTCEYLKGRIE